MKNNKGQALVEFILVMPIFLLLILSVIDFGNIITKKYALENDLDTVTDMYKDKKHNEINTYIDKKNIDINYSYEDGLYVISLKKQINIASPMLNLIFGKTYEINTEKSIYLNE